MDGQDNTGTNSKVEVVSDKESQKAAEYGESPEVESIEGEQVTAGVPVVVLEPAAVVEEMPAPVEVVPEVVVGPIIEAPTTPEPAPAVPEPVVVETPPPVEPVAAQETLKSVKTEIATEKQPEKVVESVPEVVETVVAPVVKPDPMEIARGLDHDVLEAAFKILAAERSSGLLKAKLSSDKIKIAENSDRVAKFVASHKNGVRRTTIADKLNMSPSKVTDYLQRLIVSGRVRAEGKTNDRRFYIS